MTNQKTAFTNLARMVLLYYNTDTKTRIHSETVVRNYHEPRNEVLDKASGLKQTYKKVVLDGDISDMIEARKLSMGDIDVD